MSFLQPWMLVALPLVAIPIIIHLINQRRYQTTQWAAMMFLLAANRMNRGYARIRQWLILLLRALAILALVLAVGRPLASGRLGDGWFGSIMGSGASETIVLLDRSPSMQAKLDSSTQTKLESGLAQITQTLQTMGTGRVVLIESNTNEPQELEGPSDLLDLPEVGPSDTSADMPAMLLTALDHIQANQLGQTDVWICSDLNQHDWRVDDGRWSSLRDAFAELGRRVRFRLLALESAQADVASAVNLSIRVEEAKLKIVDDESSVLVSVKIHDRSGDVATNTQPTIANRTVPVALEIDGTRTTVDVDLQGGVGELTSHRLPLGRGQTRGHGVVSIPADSNMADNEFHFAIDALPQRRAVIVSEDEEIARVLQLAAETSVDENTTQVAEIVAPEDVGSIAWDELGLVLWQTRLPEQVGGTTTGKPSADASAIQAFVQRGGNVVFFPPSRDSDMDATASLFSVAWDRWQQVDKPVAVTSWRGDTDILAATLAGASLPVGSLKVNRFATFSGEATPLATLANGSPLLSRVPTLRGGVYFCATTPRATDSSLAIDGVVFYVMIQRALVAGARSLGNTRQLVAGEADREESVAWQRLSGRRSAYSSENAFVSGVYLDPSDERLFAINRSPGEDQAATVKDEQLATLFQGLAMDRVDHRAGRGSSLVEEVWRAFLILMLIAMIGEACLCLPKQRSEESVALTGGVAA